MSTQVSTIIVKNRFLRLFYGALLVAFLALLGWPPRLAYADTYIVTTTADSGAGSLRQAILDANAKSDPDLITFSLNVLAPTIQPLTPLPALTEPVEINGLGSHSCGTFPPQPQVMLDGTLAGPNADGLQLSANQSKIVGLYITRFSQDGIDISASDTIVACNIIGLDTLGAAAGNGQHGVRIGEGGQHNLIGEDSSLVGYPSSVTGNVIAGNRGDGIRLEGRTTANNDVIGNFIGVTIGATMVGDQARPNAGAGIRLIDATNTGIGSIYFKDTGNRIAYNGLAGIVLAGAASGAQIQSNQIYSNSGLGIDLDEDGVTPNDLGDGDGGANERQNFPVITEAYVVGNEATVVRGTLNSVVTSRFSIEIFATPTCDASGFGEGAEWLGDTEIALSDSSGNGQFTLVLDRAVPVGHQLTATAEYSDINEVKPGQSSEFSACKAVDPAPPATTNLPIAHQDSATTAEDSAIILDVLANDTHPNNSPLTLVAVDNPGSGTTQIINNQILYTPSPNFNGDIAFFYSVSDGNANNTVSAHVRITVTPVNDPPIDIMLDANSIAETENQQWSYVKKLIGTLDAVDPEDNGFFNFSLTGTDNDNAFFEIVGTQLFPHASFDFEAQASYTIQVSVTDGSGATFAKELTIAVVDVNEPPILINLSNNRIDENQAVGMTVGGLTSVDQDAGDTHTYTLVSGTGSDDNAGFRLEGSTLQTNAVLDSVAKSIYSIRIRSTDRAGASRQQIFAIYFNSNFEASNDFRLKPNGYSFSNWRFSNDEATNFDNATLMRMFGASNVCQTGDTAQSCVLTAAARTWRERSLQFVHSGHCYGMAISSQRFFAGLDQPGNYQRDATTTYDLKGDTAIRHHISEMAITQSLSPADGSDSGWIYTNLFGHKPSDILTLIRTQLQTRPTDPYELGIYIWGGQQGHAVTPYAIQNRGNGVYWLHIYDNNWPGVDRYIVFNVNEETWLYNMDHPNPANPGDAWQGGDERWSLALRPTSAHRLSGWRCPFCNGTVTASGLVANKQLEFSLSGRGRLLVVDPQQQATGWDFNAKHAVNTIPGAEVINYIGGIGVEANPTIRLPLPITATPFTAYASGDAFTATTTVDFMLMGPGYTVGVNSITLAPQQQLRMDIRPDGRQIAFNANETGAFSPTIVLASDVDPMGNGYVFAVGGITLAPGKTVTVTLDLENQTLHFVDNNHGPDTYAMKLLRITPAGAEQLYQTEKVALNQSTSGAMNFGAWDGVGAIAFTLDGQLQLIANEATPNHRLFLPLVTR